MQSQNECSEHFAKSWQNSAIEEHRESDWSVGRSLARLAGSTGWRFLHGIVRTKRATGRVCTLFSRNRVNVEKIDEEEKKKGGEDRARGERAESLDRPAGRGDNVKRARKNRKRMVAFSAIIFHWLI